MHNFPPLKKLSSLVLLALALQPFASKAATYEFKRPQATLVVVGSTVVPSGAGGATKASSARWSTTSLVFGGVAVGSSLTKNVTLYNDGDGAGDFSAFAGLAPGLTADATTCTSVAPGTGCSVRFTFTPVGSVALSAPNVYPAAGAHSNVLNVTGQGLLTAVSLSTGTLDFGSIPLSTTSSAKSVMLSNSGNTDVSIGALNFSGQYVASTTCGSTLAAGTSCYVNVSFKPTSSGTQPGSVSLGTGAGAQNVTLTGVGQSATGELTVASGYSSDFGTVSAGSSATRSFVFTNTGADSLAGVYAGAAGTGFSVASVGNTCGTQAAPVTLVAKASCQFNVVFNPANAGPVAGAQARVTSTATNSPSVLSLTGTGQASGTTYTVGFNGTQGSTTFTDTTSFSSWASVGGAALTTSTFSEGTSAVSLNGKGQAVVGPVINLVNDFTVQVSVRPTAYPGGTSAIVGQWQQTVGQGGWLVFMNSNGTISFELGAISDYAAQMTSTTAAPLNQWTKVTVTRQGSTFRMYLNGVLNTTYTNATVGRSIGVSTSMGSYYSGNLGAGYWFTGQLDDLKIQLGTAVTP